MAEPTNEPNPTTTTTTTATTTSTSTWGTLEELLLACAVHRYGTASWDSVALELQKRFSTSPSFSLFTPLLCQQKYRDLQRRFAGRPNSGEDSGGDTSVWLDELRKLRVAELRRELHRYDLSIVSLQLKVKRLKEEREQGSKDERENLDLQNKNYSKTNDDDYDDKVDNSHINGEAKNEPPENVAGDGEIRRRNDSVNESNSTELVKPEPVESVRVVEPVGEEDSCNGSSNSEKKVGGESVRERVDSGELVESVAESKGEEGERVKESSDVQSTVRREKVAEMMAAVSGNSSGEENQSAATKSTGIGGLQPLIGLLEVVRVKKIGSVFERRLESQETPKYRDLIRQHIDLGIIQRKLEEGQYADCHAKFYRDLMLLVNNAILFFNKNSVEHKAALELRQLVVKHSQSHLHPHKMKSTQANPKPPAPPPKTPKPDPTPPPDQTTNLKPKLAITGPVIACRKRSSIAGKPSHSSGGERKEQPASEKEKTSSSSFNAVTKKRTRDQSFGSRSSSSKNTNDSNNNKSLKPNPTVPPVSAKGENSTKAKADRKKPSPGGISSSSKVKRGASGSDNGLLLDLLKKSTDQKNGSNNSRGGNKSSDRSKDQGPRNILSSKPGNVKEKEKGKEERGSPARRNTNTGGRPPKRAAAVAAMGKRGRDGGGDAEALSKKRQRK